MNEAKHDHEHHEVHHHPRWKRVHHTWILGRGVPDATRHDHLRHNWRPILGPARPVETALNARARKIKPFRKRRLILTSSFNLFPFALTTLKSDQTVIVKGHMRKSPHSRI